MTCNLYAADNLSINILSASWMKEKYYVTVSPSQLEADLETLKAIMKPIPLFVKYCLI